MLALLEQAAKVMDEVRPLRLRYLHLTHIRLRAAVPQPVPMHATQRSHSISSCWTRRSKTLMVEIALCTLQCALT